MLLAVDIVNSSITIGGFREEAEPVFTLRFGAGEQRSADEYVHTLRQALQQQEIEAEEISDGAIASVVPALTHTLVRALELLGCQRVLTVGAGVKTGFSVRTDAPGEVGADIIAASVAVHNIYGSPSLIIDMGTATKMTVLNHKGAFIGTSIIPGVIMGLSALSERTAQLPRISLELPHSIIAKNTADCMRSGVLYGNAAMVDGMIDRINEEFGEKLTVYATGGMASTVIPLCRHNIITDEHLVLRGLNILYRKNRPAT